MAIATTSDTTRIFFDRTAFLATMRLGTLQGILAGAGIEAEVYTMATSVGIDCKTIELADVAALLKQHGLI